MRLLLVVSQNSYLFRDLFLQIIEEFEKRGLEIALIISAKAQWEMSDAITRNLKVYHFGSALSDLEKQEFSSRFKFHYSTIKALFKLKSEIKLHIKSFNPDVVLTPDSYDPVLQAIYQLKPKLPIYYLQHSNIISKHGVLSNRSRVQNILTRLFTGISLNFSTTTPPFYSRKLTYILWSTLWSNNVDSKKYKIIYLPKIMTNQAKELRYSFNNRSIILVALNKLSYIGKDAWYLYAEFYKKSLFKFKDRVVFKVHPNGDLAHAQAYFTEFQVVKGDIDMTRVQMVISHWSSFLYESAQLNIPFLLVNPAETFDLKKFRMDNYKLTVTTKEELNNSILEISSGSFNNAKLRDEFMKLHFGDSIGSTPVKLLRVLTSHL